MTEVQIKAVEKLEALKAYKLDEFSELVLTYLIGRCKEDTGLSEDVVQEHKTWKKCFDYIYSQARKVANDKKQCAVRNDVVFEWAEDYYHLDDKAIEEREKKEAAEKKKKKEELAKKQKEKSSGKIDSKAEKNPAKPKKPVEKPEKIKEEKKPAKPKNELEGQFSLFDMF